MGAAWTAAHLLGSLKLPPASVKWAQTTAELRWMEQFSAGRHARGTSVIPFSMHAVDEVMRDLELDVGRLTRVRQWLLPVDPAAYRAVGTAVLKRHGLAPRQPAPKHPVPQQQVPERQIPQQPVPKQGGGQAQPAGRSGREHLNDGGTSLPVPGRGR